jgi:two-component system cell cycle sensor histidine kinase/response regulator CckA
MTPPAAPPREEGRAPAPRTPARHAAGIAHDINNLLAAIRAAAEAIAACPEATDEIRADAGQIVRDVARGAALARHLLPGFGQPAAAPSVLSIGAALTDAAGLLRRLAGPGIAVMSDLQAPEACVLIDPDQFDRVLINLTVNAREAMPEGGVLRLGAGHAVLAAPRAASPDTIPAGDYVTISVADSGGGIPPDLLARVFEPLFSTRQARGGSGLGLSTVRDIVRQAGGFLELESTPGRGTCVRIYLPRHAGPPAPPAPDPIAAPPIVRAAGGVPIGRVALVVEDEPTLRHLQVRAMTQAGWRVLAAESTEAALALLAAGAASESQPSVVVTDMSLPGRDGLALVHALRARWPGLPAVLVSGYTVSVPASDEIAGRVVCVAKPFVMDELLAAVAWVTAAGPELAC